jgi:hypothetical protein
MDRPIKEIEDELDALQLEYVNEDDEFVQMDIERKFVQCLEEATAADGVLRVAAGITINNWTR